MPQIEGQERGFCENVLRRRLSDEGAGAKIARPRSAAFDAGGRGVEVDQRYEAIARTTAGHALNHAEFAGLDHALDVLPATAEHAGRGGDRHPAAGVLDADVVPPRQGAEPVSQAMSNSGIRHAASIEQTPPSGQ